VRERCTHVLFDFFGTLVDYSASWTEHGFQRSHDLLRATGVELAYPEFLAEWSRTFAEFDQASERSGREFSMTDIGAAFLTATLGRAPEQAHLDAFVTRYVEEWSAGVRYPAGVAELVLEMAGSYRLAVVSNTHDTGIVPHHLEAMGILPAFDVVITSVDIGWRKPHPAIYSTALDALGIGATAAVFVGDTYGPDYVGPERAGIRAFLIDPDHRTPVPDPRRLASILDLPLRLTAG
jgi:putative hydrolase of the HAD superfamily